jgi:translation elongation factor EF-Tu-like GTPase
MKLIVNIKFISTEDGGRQNSVVNGYRPSIRSANTGLRACVFNLPTNKTLELGKTYNNVQIELLNQSNDFAVQSRVYIYEGARLVAEAVITKIIP